MGVSRAVALALLAPALSFGATRVHVPPGVGTLQAAIDAAEPGTELRLHAGCYVGPVVINKDRIKIRAADFATIDGSCAATPAIQVAADDVSIKGKLLPILYTHFPSLRVINGSGSEIAVGGHDGVKIDTVTLGFGWPDCPASCYATTGVTVTGATRTRLTRIDVGSTDTGIHVKDVVSDARLRLYRVYIDVEKTGLLIENSGVGALPADSGISVTRSVVGAGLFECTEPSTAVSFVNSSGVLFTKVAFRGSLNLQFDATSNNNVFQRSGSQGSTCSPSVIDAGSGNCINPMYSLSGLSPCS